MNIKLLAVALSSLVALAGMAHAGDGQPATFEDLKLFEKFIGVWAPAEATPSDSPRAAFNSERYEWGPVGATINFTQGPHKTDRSKDVVPGYIFWHPVKKQIGYRGYNTRGKFYFEGYYSEIEPDVFELRYKVYYPEGALKDNGDGLSLEVREYRDTHRLTDENTMELETFVKVGDGEWRRFPSPEARDPTVMKRVH